MSEVRDIVLTDWTIGGGAFVWNPWKGWEIHPEYHGRWYVVRVWILQQHSAVILTRERETNPCQCFEGVESVGSRP